MHLLTHNKSSQQSSNISPIDWTIFQCWLQTPGALIHKSKRNQSHLSKKKYHKAELFQRRVCFVNVQSSLLENVVFSVCARKWNATYVIFIMWNSISGLDTCYHFRLNIRCGGAVTVRTHQKKISGNFLRGGEGGRCFWGMGQFLRSFSIFR